MENLPEHEADNDGLMKLPAIMHTPEDLVEWMLSFLTSTDKPVDEWERICHSEVHILIPGNE
ncbi:hypothetical protein AS034_10845 [[Bacillus] enclensis]|jgi:hypothetical protein|uniref:Uncharacterized protein n=1 Tax=[Bacillus] enclensis TaxID=1402860 RepID=A0A0V8HJ88_9BACI|nr:hypothetical protein [[Bacillus] enclensis]OAT82750.1 hypothetical protein A6P54_09465 [Bacillus sp. MKU004]QTC42495.1 hypothetical protein I7V34_04345 [Bacillus sp. V3]QWC24588.1 hypothetical protein KJK41_09820 [Bacillus haikouensis]KSU62606.1 hypothetical protein AS034_10845 [[Bacillus] enclensis]MBH9965364.1 hypothetical protein [[Bacillus] enclensis]